MKCALSLFTKIVTILFTLILLTKIVCCCSLNTYEIISLMHRDPDYQRDPCYIQWKADQDAKLQNIWADRDKLEKSIAENNRIRYANEVQERQNRQNSYRTVTVEKKKESYVWILGVILAVIIGIFCCAVCCSLKKSEDNPTAFANTLQADRNLGDSTIVLPSNASRNQTRPDLLSTTNANNLIVARLEIRQHPETNVPFLPRGVTRQNSLPSYEDAIKIPSAPPKE